MNTTVEKYFSHVDNEINKFLAQKFSTYPRYIITHITLFLLLKKINDNQYDKEKTVHKPRMAPTGIHR